MDLPEEFSLLKNLESLSLRSNPLRTVPESISKLKKLKSLDLSYCLIEQLTYNFYNLKSLEVLDLSYNRLEHFDSRIKIFEQLKVLNLCGNDLTGIQPGLLHLCQIGLEVLNLNDNPLLYLLPKEIKQRSVFTVQSLKVLARLTIRNKTCEANEQKKQQKSFSLKPDEYLFITNFKEDSSASFELKKVPKNDVLLPPVGSCCWCGLDRYDDINTVCIHCVDIFTYSMVPIRMLCCGVKCVKEASQCKTAEQFTKRYYGNYQNI
uniref:Uncharacterized protein n=1 Tax=Trichobilharzia regenti TaxID=157069 RepID=A0AA85K8W5_TRIRE|nr:unnamed protein product [Trichobilharzia regenti]